MADIPQTLQKPTSNLAPAGETAASVLAAQAEALVKARFQIALHRPRDLDAVRQRLMRECQRPSFAAVAIYHKPIGKGVEGPSVRFAEAAIQAMGNLVVETPAIYDDAEKRILRISVADMETNVVHSKDVTVLKRVERSTIYDGQRVIRERVNSKGRPVYVVEATDDEILNTENALVSKALRTTGLRLVPGWLIDECMAAVRATRQKEGAADPDAAKRKLLDAFAAVGVTAEQIREWLGHSPENVAPIEREQLLGIYTALKDGDTSWREVMDAKWQEQMGAMDANAQSVAPGKAVLRDRIKAMAQPSTPAATTEDSTLEPGQDPAAVTREPGEEG